MSARVTWTGLDEFLREFGSIPQELNSQGMEILREETEGAAVELAQSYKRVTGNLARGVKTEYPSATILVGIVRNKSPHSHLWHWGTTERKTNSGWNRGRMWGKTAKPREPLVPIVRRRRARMARRMVDMLRRFGFQIGDA